MLQWTFLDVVVAILALQHERHAIILTMIACLSSSHNAQTLESNLTNSESTNS
jgi:hypothetical protein